MRLFEGAVLAIRNPGGHAFPEGTEQRANLLRRLNPIVTRVLVDLREKLAPFYSDIGRPSIDLS